MSTFVNFFKNFNSDYLARMKLKYYMTSLIIPVMIIMTIISSGTVFIFGKSIIEKQAEEYLKNVAKTSRDSLDQFIDDREHEAKLTSSILGHTINFGNPNLNMIHKILGESIQGHYQEFENNMVINTNGIIIASGKNRKKTINIDFNKLSPIFKENFDKSLKGKFYISDIDKSPVTNLPVVLLTSPIFNQNKKVVGIYGIAINLNEWTEKFLSKIQMGKSGYAYLMNKKGVVIHHPDRNLMLKSVTKYPFIREMIKKEKGIFRYQYKGFNKIVATSSSSLVPWIVCMAITEEDLFSDKVSFGITIGTITFIFILAVVLVIYLLSNKISANLETLKEEIKSFALGEADLTKKIEIREIYEFQIISEWFNKFINSIGNVIKTIIETAANLDSIMQNFEKNIKDTTSSIHNQFSSIEQTSTSLEEINSLSELIQKKIQNINNLSESLRDVVNTNYSKMEGMSYRIQNLNTVTKGNLTDMRQLEQRTSQIGDIMKTINEMANQTKIIAFNAALEASSGDSSEDIIKRFNVIVSEIRRLAENVTESADEIKGKLVKIQDTTQNLAGTFEETVTDIDTINEFFDDLYSEYNNLRENESIISSEIDEINESLDNENNSISQIYDAILDIKNVSNDILTMHDSLNSEYSSVFDIFKNIENYIKSFKV